MSLSVFRVYLVVLGGAAIWGSGLSSTVGRIVVLALVFAFMLSTSRGLYNRAFEDGVDRGLALDRFSEEWIGHMKRQRKSYE